MKSEAQFARQVRAEVRKAAGAMDKMVRDDKTTATISHIDSETGEIKELATFGLESPPPPGKVPQRVIEELVSGKQAAVDFAQAFGECVKEQAEKYKVKPGALRRYVTALVADKVAELDAENDDLARLLGEEQA